MYRELICERKKEAVNKSDKLTDIEKLALTTILDEIAANAVADLVAFKLYEFNRALISIMQSRGVDLRELMFTEKEVEAILDECMF